MSINELILILNSYSIENQMEILKRSGLYPIVADATVIGFMALSKGRTTDLDKNLFRFWDFVVGNLSVTDLSMLIKTVEDQS